MPDDHEATPAPGCDHAELTAALAAEVAEALSYGLRYDARGKPRRGGEDITAGLAAERLMQHLDRAGFVVMRRRPARPHSAG